MPSGMVYLIQVGDLYKIGRTRSLFFRIKTIGAELNMPVRLLRCWYTTEPIAVENLLHAIMASERIIKEWFRLSYQHVDCLRKINLSAKAITAPHLDIAMMGQPSINLKAHDLFAEYQIFRPIDLSKRARLSRQYAHLIWTGARGITRKMARKIEAATGIPYDRLMAAIPPEKPSQQIGDKGDRHAER